MYLKLHSLANETALQYRKWQLIGVVVLRFGSNSQFRHQVGINLTVINKAHSFQRAAEFRGKPQNLLALACKNQTELSKTVSLLIIKIITQHNCK